jgi:hypothetical protein
LDAIIAVGYRVNSKRATAFRQWATSILRDYAIKSYIIDRKRNAACHTAKERKEGESEKFFQEVTSLRLHQ